MTPFALTLVFSALVIPALVVTWRTIAGTDGQTAQDIHRRPDGDESIGNPKKPQ